MRKKLLSILLLAAMTVTMLAGCGDSSGDKKDSGEGASNEGSSKEGGSSSDEGDGASGEAVDMTKIKIGAIQSFTVDDGGWCQAMNQGILDAMKACGIPEENLITVENVAETPTDIEAAFESLVDEGATVIIGCSSGYASTLSELAPDFPEVTIVQQGDQIENLIGIQIRGYEGMFLAGYTCALLSPTDTLGFAASMNEASVRTAINAYALGARYANEKATVQVVWADSWYDIDIETQNALSLINSGITYMGIEASSPAIPQTCEEKGAFVVGYNVDMQANAPKAVLTSFMWNWEPIFTDIFNSVADGTAKSTDYYYVGGECSALAPFNNDLVPEDVQAKVKEAREKINSGEIKIYGGELKDVDGNVLVKEGEVMSDEDINLQNFFVENVKGAQ